MEEVRKLAKSEEDKVITLRRSNRGSYIKTPHVSAGHHVQIRLLMQPVGPLIWVIPQGDLDKENGMPIC